VRPVVGPHPCAPVTPRRQRPPPCRMRVTHPPERTHAACFSPLGAARLWSAGAIPPPPTAARQARRARTRRVRTRPAGDASGKGRARHAIRPTEDPLGTHSLGTRPIRHAQSDDARRPPTRQRGPTAKPRRTPGGDAKRAVFPMNRWEPVHACEWRLGLDFGCEALPSLARAGAKHPAFSARRSVSQGPRSQAPIADRRAAAMTTLLVDTARAPTHARRPARPKVTPPLEQQPPARNKDPHGPRSTPRNRPATPR
jgi:hypothetical protein